MYKALGLFTPYPFLSNSKEQVGLFRLRFISTNPSVKRHAHLHHLLITEQLQWTGTVAPENPTYSFLPGQQKESSIASVLKFESTGPKGPEPCDQRWE